MYSHDLLDDEMNFQIERTIYRNNVSMPSSHYHNHYEILYIENGMRTIFINEKKHSTLNQYNIALLPPNIIHSTKSSNNETQNRILINISQNLINQLVDFTSQYIISGFDAIIIPLTVYDIKILKWYLEQFFEIQKNSQMPHKDDNIKTLLSSFLITLANINYNYQNEDNMHYDHFQNALNLDKIIQFISSHYHEDITLSDLADKAATSEQHLIRIFTKKFQVTPIKYLNIFRITTSKRMLENNKMNISEVARSCGYNSSAHFSRTFKQITGITPKMYQKKFQNNKKPED